MATDLGDFVVGEQHVVCVRRESTVRQTRLLAINHQQLLCYTASVGRKQP